VVENGLTGSVLVDLTNGDIKQVLGLNVIQIKALRQAMDKIQNSK